jgi:hypothetical protein
MSCDPQKIREINESLIGRFEFNLVKEYDHFSFIKPKLVLHLPHLHLTSIAKMLQFFHSSLSNYFPLHLYLNPLLKKSSFFLI